MTRLQRLALVLPLLCGAVAVTPPPAVAQEEDGDDEFDTSWIGGRIGIWYRPSMDMRLQVSNASLQTPGGQVLIGTTLDVKEDLGIQESPTSDYMFKQGILELEFFVDSEWVTFSAWGVAPFQYEGEATLRRTINFGGVQFGASTPVRSRFEQFMFAADVRIHILNNQFVRLSPLVGLRVLGIDWEIRQLPNGFVGDTSDIDSPLEYDGNQLLPYPEIGLEVRAGYRELIEVDAKLSGMYVSLSGYEGGTIMFDGGVTVYPIPYLGIRAGVRYVELDFKDKQESATDGHYDFDLEYLGFTAGALLRF